MSARGKRLAQARANRQRVLKKQLRRRARRAALRPAAAGAATALALTVAGVSPAIASGGVDRSTFSLPALSIGAPTDPSRAGDGATPQQLARHDDRTQGQSQAVLVPGTGAERGAAIAGTLFFVSSDADAGWELWKSDGTTAGTVLVKDIQPGSGYSYPRALTVVGSTVFFVADDGTNGPELWKSDGTSAGTVLVKAIDPEPGTAPDPGSSPLSAARCSSLPTTARPARRCGSPTARRPAPSLVARHRPQLERLLRPP